MNHRDIVKFLLTCDGVVRAGPSEIYLESASSILEPPAGTIIQLEKTAYAGTVGRVVKVEVKTRKEAGWWVNVSNGHYLAIRDTVCIYEVDGNTRQYRTNMRNVKLMPAATPTVRIRSVPPASKRKIKLKTKFGQPIEVGAWVAAVDRKRLRIGKVTRFTESSVWITLGDHTAKKPEEHWIRNPAEVFVIPESAADAVESEMVMARLKNFY